MTKTKLTMLTRKAAKEKKRLDALRQKRRDSQAVMVMVPAVTQSSAAQSFTRAAVKQSLQDAMFDSLPPLDKMTEAQRIELREALVWRWRWLNATPISQACGIAGTQRATMRTVVHGPTLEQLGSAVGKHPNVLSPLESALINKLIEGK